MPPIDIDIVSDLNEPSADVTIPASTGSQPTSAPVTEPTPQATKVDTQAAPKAADKAPSLRDQISSAVKGEPVTPDTATKDGPVRNPDGTFAPKPKEGVAQAVDPVTGTPVSQAPVQPAGAVGSTAVPAGIDPAVFNALPAETQANLARTMETLNERQARLVGHESIEQMIAPRRQAWALNGMTEAQAVNQLFALSDFASEKPGDFIKYFAQQSGIDLEELIFGADDNTTGDPAVDALKQQVSQLQGQLQGFTSQQQQAAHQQTVSEVLSFFEQKDDAGNLLRPHAETLGTELTPYVQMARQQNPNRPMPEILQEAYERACWANPTTRAKMQEAATTASQAEALRAQQERSRAAQAAGSSVAPGVPTAAPASPTDVGMSVRDSIKAAIAASS